MSIINIIMIMQYWGDYFTILIYGGSKMVADRIKDLREQKNMTQAELAKQLEITRSSVNAWEMGISVPSTQYIVEISSLFKVSSDYLLGIDNYKTLDISGLDEKDVQLVYHIVNHLRDKNNK